MDPELAPHIAEMDTDNDLLTEKVDLVALVKHLHRKYPDYLERFIVDRDPQASASGPGYKRMQSSFSKVRDEMADVFSEMSASAAARAEADKAKTTQPSSSLRRGPKASTGPSAQLERPASSEPARIKVTPGPSAQPKISAEVRPPVPSGPSAQPIPADQNFSEDAEMPNSDEFITVTSRSQKRKLKTPKAQTAPPKKVQAKEKSFASSDKAQARPSEGPGDSNMEEPRGERVPPLYIREKSQWEKLVPLIDRLGIVFNYARSTAVGIRVQCPDSANHRRLSATLRSEKIGYHTYALQDERVLRTVIRGLPRELSTDLIKEDLLSQEIPVLEVHRMYQRRSKDPYDMVLVIAELTPAGHRIRDLTSVCRLSGLKFEDPEGRGKAMQCHNCQTYGHGARYCFTQPRCVKCLESHLTADCPRKQPTEEPPSCVLCGDKGHPANYRGCPKAPKGLKRRVKPTGRKNAPPPPEKFIPAPPPATNAWFRPASQPTPEQASPKQATANNGRVPPPCPPAAAPASAPKPARAPAPPRAEKEDDTSADNWQYVNYVLDLIDLDELDAYVRESKINSTRALFKYSKLLRAIGSLRNNVNG